MTDRSHPFLGFLAGSREIGAFSGQIGSGHRNLPHGVNPTAASVGSIIKPYLHVARDHRNKEASRKCLSSSFDSLQSANITKTPALLSVNDRRLLGLFVQFDYDGVRNDVVWGVGVRLLVQAVADWGLGGREEHAALEFYFRYL